MLDHGQVRTMLPHAPPMVLVDRVEWLDPGRALHAVKAISGSEPCYLNLPAGLARQRYAYPVSLMVESFAQAAVVLWRTKEVDPLAVGDGVMMFVVARDCRFHGNAYPGDVLRHVVELERVVANTAFVAGEIRVGDRQIATIGSLVAAARRGLTGRAVTCDRD